MAVFLVFRELPGVTRDQYGAAQRAVTDAIRKAAASLRVRYGGGFFLPATGRAICVFDADTAADVTTVNRQAGVPFTDVLKAIDLRLDEPPPGAHEPSPKGDPP